MLLIRKYTIDTLPNVKELITLLKHDKFTLFLTTYGVEEVSDPFSDDKTEYNWNTERHISGTFYNDDSKTYGHAYRTS